jgi:hypothetical protein
MFKQRGRLKFIAGNLSGRDFSLPRRLYKHCQNSAAYIAAACTVPAGSSLLIYMVQQAAGK